jgi:hypothetical protein
VDLLKADEEESALWQAMRPQAQFVRLIIFGLAMTVGLRGQVNEYQVKAFFLSNFTRYVEWPAQSFHSPQDPIVICVLGQNPFAGALEEATRGKLVEGRALLVRQVSEIQPPCRCHVLFVSAPERKRFRSTAGVIKGSGVLTVGEMQGFLGDGGVVNFKVEEGKVRFEINMEAAGEERLHISSKLLRLAQIARK